MSAPDESDDADESSRSAEVSLEVERPAGRRTPYDATPPALQAWAVDVLGGPVARVTPRTGGMSPAVAVSLRRADGAGIFVKAVSRGINPDTPHHFRHERAVLSALPPAPYRATLLDSYDDGDWIALALEDIAGRHPDYQRAEDRAAVQAAVRQQSDELTPPPDGLPLQSVEEQLTRWLTTMETAEEPGMDALPTWARIELPRLVDLARSWLQHYRNEAYCHWDLRYDNILLRHSNGAPVLLDWGVSRRGPRWADLAVYALEWVETSYFEEVVASARLTQTEERDVTALLAGFGCHCLLTWTLPAPQGLPLLREFQRRLGSACLIGVRRRLDR